MLDLPSDLFAGGRLVIDTVGKAYMANHRLIAHCWCGPRSRTLDLLAIIERRGHASPLDQVKARCAACGRRANIIHNFVQWNVSGHLMPYPEPPGPGRSRDAWEADYRAYRARREAESTMRPTPPADAAAAAADRAETGDQHRSAAKPGPDP